MPGCYSNFDKNGLLNPDRTVNNLKFKKFVFSHHPDKGGDPEVFKYYSNCRDRIVDKRTLDRPYTAPRPRPGPSKPKARKAPKSPKAGPSRPRARKAPGPKTCPQGKVVNPLTNRCITIGKATYNKVFK